MRDIVFDLGGVLIDWDPRYLFRDHLGGSARDVEDFLGTVCTQEWHARLDGGGRFAELTEQLTREHPSHRAWIECYRRDWERMFKGELAESVEQFGRLRAQGYRLHALSNYPAEQIAFLFRAFSFMVDFHTVVLSGLIGVTKPDERIYAYMLDRIGTRDCAYVDDREENVLAARRCGMHAVHFVRGSGFAELAAIVGA